MPLTASTSVTVSATAIAAGLAHSCALTRAGGVKCWGSNGHDELGNGTTRDSLTPVDVSGLTTGVRAVAAGVRHHCALTSAGGVKCWGNTSFGNLGDGTNVRRFTPVDVSGLSSGVRAIAAGMDHTCALTTAGGVKCWGYNRFAALGDGTTTDRWTPVDVSGLTSGVTAIAAGFGHSCALMGSGGVKCWGSVAGERRTPVDVPGLSGVRAIATSGGHSCALTSAGGVKCWGGNANGQLGDGTLNSSTTPVDVIGLSGGVTAIAAGTGGSCALTTAGGVRCWGLNDHGQLGDGTTANRSTSVAVSGLSRGVTAIAAGAFHTCALTSGGGVKCWGLNGSGQLGDKTTVDRRMPVGVRGFWPTATLALLSRSVLVTPTRHAALKLRCVSQVGCPGTVTLTTAGAVKLGSRRFAIAAVRTHVVRVRLTNRGFELLSRVKRLSARVRISYAQPSGGTTTAVRTITLSAP